VVETTEQDQNETLTPILTQEDWDDYVAQNPIIEEEIEQPVEQPVSVDSHVLLGTLKLTPNDNVICIGEVHLEGDVHIYGDISLEVDRIENNTLYGVKIKKG
jgi:hypothetical protein